MRSWQPLLAALCALFLRTVSPGQNLLFEPQWSTSMVDQPSCLVGGDLDGDRLHEVVVGTYASSVRAFSSFGRKLWEVRTPTIPAFLRVYDVDKDGRQEVVVICFPNILVLDGNGGVRRTIPLQRRVERVMAFEIDTTATGQTPEFVLLMKGCVVRLDPTGEILATIPLAFDPFKMKLADLDGDGISDILLLDGFRVACYSPGGRQLWMYERPPAGHSPRAFLQSIDAQLTRTTPRTKSVFAPPPVKDCWKDLEPIDVGVFGSEGYRVAAAFFSETREGVLATDIVCLDSRNGEQLWAQTVPDLALSMKIVDSSVYVCGGRDDGKRKSGYAIRIDRNGRIAETRRYEWPAHFLRQVGNYAAHGEYLRVIRCYVDSSHDGSVMEGILAANSLYAFEPIELNGDGYPDLALVFPSYETPGQFWLAVAINLVPSYLKAGEKAWTQYRTFSLDGNDRNAERARMRAERYYAAVGMKSEAALRQHAVEEQVSRLRRDALLRTLAWFGLVALLLIGTGLKYRRPIVLFVRRIPGSILPDDVEPSAELLDSINAFIHESIKKVKMMMLAIREMNAGRTGADMVRFFDENLEAFRQTFREYRRDLSMFERLRGRNDRTIGTLLDKIVRLRNTGKAIQSPDAIAHLLTSLQDYIDGNLRSELGEYRHSIADAVRESVDVVRKEASHKLKRSGLTIRLHLGQEDYPRELYRQAFEKWKLVFTNLLRNAVEAVECALEQDPFLPAHRRVVTVTLQEADESNGLGVLEIEDRGCGMDDDTRAKMFRSGFSWGKKDGTGQGLTPDLETFILRNGKLIVQSTKNVGTLVRIEINNL